MEPVDVFTKSYDEVLAALKHQDEKLNRTLITLAFLTGAGVALILNLDKIIAGHPANLGSGPSVTGLMFVVFIVAVAMALALALAAIGPSSPLSFPGKRPEANSLLFWGEIAHDGAWDAKGTEASDPLTRRLQHDLHEETRKIALRVKYKVARSRESSAFVHFAIVSLALIGIFGTGALSTRARWWIAAGLLGLVLLLPFFDWLNMKFTAFPEDGSRIAYSLLAIAVGLTFTLLVLGQTEGYYWTALYNALGVLLLSRLALISQSVAVVLVPIALVGSACAFVSVVA